MAKKKLSLSQKAILLINSIPEVSSTLVGMRNEEYVDDVINSIKNKYFDNYKEIWHNISQLTSKF